MLLGGTKAAMRQPQEISLHPPSDEDPQFTVALSLSRNRAKLNEQILETVAEFVTATNLNCRQTPSSAMHGFILI
jgi:hypothetical protein